MKNQVDWIWSDIKQVDDGTQLDEISRKTLRSYLAKTDTGPEGKDYDTPREFRNRGIGRSTAAGKISRGTSAKKGNNVKVKATGK